ncbi:hypothetical protein OIU78_020241, partial [Salix suchowensis]
MRNLVIGLLFLTVLSPIFLYTDMLSASFTPYSSKQEDVNAFTLPSDTRHLNVLPQEESSTVIKEPIGIVYTDHTNPSSNTILTEKDLHLPDARDHKYARVLSATDEKGHSQTDNIIKQVIQTTNQEEEEESQKDNGSDRESHQKTTQDQLEQQSAVNSGKDDEKDALIAETNKQTDQTAMPDARVRQLRDQLIRARVYLSLPATKNNPHFTRELRMRVKEVQRVLVDATKDSDLPKNAYAKLNAMDQLLEKGKQMQDDCATMVKKLRAMLQSTEEQLRVHKKQTMFLTQLTAKTLPKGLHCLPLRLTTEYYNLNSTKQQFPNQEKLDDPSLHHIALFSDNVLAAAVVVNSTITNSKHPSKLVFHVVSDRLNYAAMRMWFLVNPPGRATIQVQNIEEFTWLNSSYSPVLKQLGSRSMIDYYFRAARASSDSNLKYRNPKYLSILNHLRFYLPEIFPKLNKRHVEKASIVFDRYLNFSNPLISKNFDPRACGWAYGMNIFDLKEWKRQNITDVYHTWQKLNHDRQLWKLGTLPPGLITFWKRTHPLDRHWHVLGLGYNPNVNQREIERAAVIHYNGNMKPWLEIGIPKYRTPCKCHANILKVCITLSALPRPVPTILQ